MNFLHVTKKVRGMLHSSEIRGLCSMKCSSETLQNLLYFMYKKTHVVFFVFHFEQLSFCPNECPALCRHRPGHSSGKIFFARNEKRKKLRGFSYFKSMANFEVFCWNFSSSTNPQIVRSERLYKTELLQKSY